MKQADGEQVMSQPWMKPMKIVLMTTTAAALLFTFPIARGQAPAEQNAPIVTSKINLSLEQRHQISEIIKELKIEEPSSELHVAIGDTVSKSVSLHPMPADVTAKISQVKSHLFFMMGGQVVIVDPKNNEIVDVIK
jgi:Protein of unknown function (DUF1236)